ncbi:MAG: tetratricopeptide repeat protein [Elusimicrobia bacterium]|nr:tetratricopeptide repeat protein [Elusimicrobiota bacterium]
MKKIIIFLFTAINLFSVLFAVQEDKNFLSGCDFYKKAEYEKAIEMFKSLEKDYPTANLYYNIANSYYRLGKIGYALLYYERAKKISPFDEDIGFNIKIIYGTIEKDENERGLLANIDMGTARLLFSLSLFFFAGVISIKFLSSKKILFWPFVVSSLMVVLFSSLYFLKYRDQCETIAVVIKSDTEIRSGPNNNFKVSFTLPEGKKIIVLNKSGEWAEIVVKSMGLRGWLEMKNIEII